MKIRWTSKGLKLERKDTNLRTLKNHFDRLDYIQIRHLISPELMAHVQEGLAKASFYTKIHTDSRRGTNIALELCMRRGAAYGLLQFLANDPAWHACVRAITGCRPIGCFNGRVYRMMSGGDHFDSWHSDIDEKGVRMVGMSVNLSERPYAGGTLQMRRSSSKKILRQIENIGLGDAVLFRLSSRLVHRITPLSGNHPKTAYAGWYQTHPPHYIGHVKPVAVHRPATQMRESKRNRSNFYLRRNAIFRRDGKRFDLLNPETGFCYALEGIGADVWKNMERPSRPEHVIGKLLPQYDVPEYRLRRDVASFTQTLLQYNLVTQDQSDPNNRKNATR